MSSSNQPPGIFFVMRFVLWLSHNFQNNIIKKERERFTVHYSFSTKLFMCVFQLYHGANAVYTRCCFLYSSKTCHCHFLPIVLCRKSCSHQVSWMSSTEFVIWSLIFPCLHMLLNNTSNSVMHVSIKVFFTSSLQGLLCSAHFLYIIIHTKHKKLIKYKMHKVFGPGQ